MTAPYAALIRQYEADVARLSREKATAAVEPDRRRIESELGPRQLQLARLRQESAAVVRQMQQTLDVPGQEAMRAALVAICVSTAGIEARRVHERAGLMTRLCSGTGAATDTCDVLRAEEEAAQRHVAALKALQLRAIRARSSDQLARIRVDLADELQRINTGIQGDETRLAGAAGTVLGIGTGAGSMDSWLPDWVKRLAAWLSNAWTTLRNALSPQQVWDVARSLLFGDGAGDDGVSGGDEALAGDLPQSGIRARPPLEAFDSKTGQFATEAVRSLWAGVQAAWETVLLMQRAGQALLQRTFGAWALAASTAAGGLVASTTITAVALYNAGAVYHMVLKAAAKLASAATATELVLVSLVSFSTGLTLEYLANMQLGSVLAAATLAPALNYVRAQQWVTGRYFEALLATSYVLTELHVRRERTQGRAVNAAVRATRLATLYYFMYMYLPHSELLRELQLSLFGRVGPPDNWAFVFNGPACAMIDAVRTSSALDTWGLGWVAATTGALAACPRSYQSERSVRDKTAVLLADFSETCVAFTDMTARQFGGALYDTDAQNKRLRDLQTKRYRTPGAAEAIASTVALCLPQGLPVPPEFAITEPTFVELAMAEPTQELLRLPANMASRLDPVSLQFGANNYLRLMNAQDKDAVIQAITDQQHLAQPISLTDGTVYSIDSVGTARALARYSQLVSQALGSSTGADGSGLIAYVPDSTTGDAVLVPSEDGTSAALVTVQSDEAGYLFGLMLSVARDEYTAARATPWGGVFASLENDWVGMYRRLGESAIATAITVPVGATLGQDVVPGTVAFVMDKLAQNPALADAAGLVVVNAGVGVAAGTVAAGASLVSAAATGSMWYVPGWSMTAVKMAVGNAIITGTGAGAVATVLFTAWQLADSDSYIKALKTLGDVVAIRDELYTQGNPLFLPGQETIFGLPPGYMAPPALPALPAETQANSTSFIVTSVALARTCKLRNRAT